MIAGTSMAPDSASTTFEKTVAAVGTAGGFTALLSAVACCVLPLALTGVGLGIGGLSLLVPYHWPLTAAAGLTVAAGWGVYARKSRACTTGDTRTIVASTRATFILLCFATAFVILAAVWPHYIEVPLMRLLGGA